MIPTFVGNDYYCESGLHNEAWEYMLYSDDPLWDGKQRLGPEAGCCLDRGVDNGGARGDEAPPSFVIFFL